MFAVGVIALFAMTVGIIGSAWTMGGDVAIFVSIGVGISAYWLIKRIINRMPK